MASFLLSLTCPAFGQFSPVDIDLSVDDDQQVFDPLATRDFSEIELPDESEPLFTNSELEVPVQSWQV